MLTELCAELKNYFLRDQSKDIHSGTYEISGGGIELPFLIDGQYFRIVGSVLNDGVYQYPVSNLDDETFTGAVWAMAVPPDVVSLADEIAAWNEANASSLNKPYQSESFGGYSYSVKSGSTRSGVASAYGWQDQFADRLIPYRKVAVL